MRAIALAVAALVSAPVIAAPEGGCADFAWPLERERALLTGARIDAVGELDRTQHIAWQVQLAPQAQAKLALPPERAPKTQTSYAGAIMFKAGRSGEYLVTLSTPAWVDAVQNGAYLQPLATTSVNGCPRVRKSLRYAVGPEPFTVQFSGSEIDVISMTLTPAP